MTSGPTDPAVRGEWARQRRRVAAAHHPDRGGDTDTYLAALAAVDRAFRVYDPSVAGRARPSAGREERVQVTRTWRGSRMRVARRTRRVVGVVRRRLPRAFPGARRSVDI